MDLDYKYTAVDHYNEASKLFKKAKSIREIIYVALELRQCIERLCFEYFDLCMYRRGGMKKKDLKLYKPKKILEKVHNIVPDLEKSIDFGNAVLKNQGINRKMVYPDCQWLHTIHGNLNSYLHLRREEWDEAGKMKLIEEIGNILSNIKDYFNDRYDIKTIDDNVKWILTGYIEGKFTKQEMEGIVAKATLPPHMYNM